MFIVELEKGVWIAPHQGGFADEPGRTLVKDNAKEFAVRKRAERALFSARRYHAFLYAEILEVD